MAEYYPLLAKAIAGLPNSTPETRRAVYERARKALLGQLQNLQPPVPPADLARETESLDAAVARLEAELSGVAPPTPQPPAPQPPVQPSATQPPVTPARPAPRPFTPPPRPASATRPANASRYIAAACNPRWITPREWRSGVGRTCRRSKRPVTAKNRSGPAADALVYCAVRAATFAPAEPRGPDGCAARGANLARSYGPSRQGCGFPNRRGRSRRSRIWAMRLSVGGFGS